MTFRGAQVPFGICQDPYFAHWHEPPLRGAPRSPGKPSPTRRGVLYHIREHTPAKIVCRTMLCKVLRNWSQSMFYHRRCDQLFKHNVLEIGRSKEIRTLDPRYPKPVRYQTAPYSERGFTVPSKPTFPAFTSTSWLRHALHRSARTLLRKPRI